MMHNAVMQDSGVEWIGGIPHDWRKDKIFRLAEFISSGGTPTSTNEDFYGGDIMWVQTGDLDNDFIYESSKQITLEGLQSSSAKKFPKNTLLIAMYGATIGKLGILGVEATTNQACCAVFVSLKMDIKFTFYLFMAMKDYLVFQSYGGGQPNISQEIIKQQYVYYPPFSEQQAIAQYLDQRCSKLDAIITIKQQQIKALDALRQSIIYQAVTKGLDDTLPLVDSGVEWLGKIPQGWRVSKLKYITNQIVDGTHFTPNYIERGVPFLRVTDIQTQSINFERIKFISEDEHTELTKRAKPQRGDILLSKNGTIGITKIVDWDWEFSIFVSLCLIKLLPNISPYYFSYFFESDVVNKQLFESSKKTSVTNLHLVKIRELLLCVPPLLEQQRIVDHLDHETQRLNTLKENLNQQISTLQAYKKALIYECVTGKKRINADALNAG
ncbi:MAG: hypothetical protein RIR39_2241 [Pseudomonadota bacterium]|jgi:type I restriction enzyme S subunit